MDGARVTVGTCLNVKRKDHVLVICDDRTIRIGEAIYTAALELTGNTVLLRVPPECLSDGEIPDGVDAAMKGASVILALTTHSVTHANAIQRASNRGARIATMPGITPRMMSKGGMTADFRGISRTMNRILRKIRRPKKALITTKLGTDLSMELKGRRWVTDDTGLCHRPKQITNLPAGEMFIAPVEKSAQGKLIVDGSFHGILEKPVEVSIEKGYATRMVYAPDLFREMESAGKSHLNVAELGIGLNPAAKIIGNVLEDGKALGTVHISFGDNSSFGGKVQASFNRDAVITKPTLVIDDRTILEDGELKI
jgi:leucyl aminopeptidase (aminopeptidase T)